MPHRFTPRSACALALVLGAGLAPLATPAQPASATSAQTAGATSAQTTVATPPIDPQPVWDLSRLYASDAAWDAERRALLAELPTLTALKGTLGRDPPSLRAALDRVSATGRRQQRLSVYANTQLSTDSRSARNQERASLMRSAAGQIASSTAWLPGEVRALGGQRVEAFIGAEPGLAKHAVRLRDILRNAQHQLSPDAEAALAAVSPVLSAPTNLRTVLINADMSWPSITVDGQAQRVNEAGYVRLRKHPDRAVREQAFTQFFGQYGRFQNTFGGLLAARVEAGVVDARLRGYPSAVAASLAAYDMPEAVLRMLVAQANEGLPTLHRYLRLRQRMLELPDLKYHDVYPELVVSERRYTLAQSAALTLDATAPLGDEYRALLRAAFSTPSMHAYPAEGKQGGAYHTAAYGEPSFVFLNHQDSYDSLTTFAHEWGHGMHSQLAQRAQPFETAGYSLFMAEIAAITNEVLLADHMARLASTRDEMVFVLAQEIERIRGAFFRQTMFAEFELMTHDAMERGESLSGQRFTSIYCGLLRKYHGADAGVMAIDPAYCSEWAYIPHFHRPFYVYVYATSSVAGGSQYPYAMLEQAGLDMASPAPYQALIRRMNALLDEIERALG